MLRKFGILLGLVALSGLVAPTPAHADNTLGVAVVTGNVTVGGDPCTVDNPKASGSETDGETVTFGGLVMAGTFNNYVGPVTAPNGITACTAFDLEVPVSSSPPVTLPLIGNGHINGGAEIRGEALHEDKCLKGTFLGGDFLQVTPGALVKFQIEFTTGTLASDCESKKATTKTNCVGAIGVAPLGSAGVPGQNDEVVGAVVCHELLPSNEPGKPASGIDYSTVGLVAGELQGIVDTVCDPSCL